MIKTLDPPSVSIILPVFFREVGTDDIRLLRRAVQSIHDQDFPSAYEIVLVDDGSPTPVESLLPLLSEDFASVRFLRCGRNLGLVHALNWGLAEARFPLIARLDADDRWLPTKIAKQIDHFIADPDLTISATGMTLVDVRQEAIETHIRPGDWNGVLRFFAEMGCPFPHGSVVARREIFRMLGGYPHDPAYSHCEDFALWGLWLRFFKANMIEEALYDYTVSPRSVSIIHAAQQRDASHEVNFRFRMLDLVDRLPTALAELASAIGGSLLQAGTLAFKMWRFRIGVRLPARALESLRVILPDRLIRTAPQSARVLELGQILGAPALAAQRTDLLVTVIAL